MSSQRITAALFMDNQDQNLGNSPGTDGRGRLHVVNVAGGISSVDWNYLKATYPTTTSEVYTFKSGGSGGVVAATITITYLAANKKQLDEVFVVIP